MIKKNICATGYELTPVGFLVQELKLKTMFVTEKFSKQERTLPFCDQYTLIYIVSPLDLICESTFTYMRMLIDMADARASNLLKPSRS